MYTIIQLPQIVPQYILVNGTAGKESRLNPGSPIQRPTSGKLYADNTDLYGTDPGRRVELYAGGIATDAEVLAACPYLKESLVASIKNARATALGMAVKNAGVLAVYDENYRAAVAYVAGQTTEIMKDGKTTAEYLAGFGSKFGMSAGQFASYIIGENRRVNPTSYAVEQEYLRLCYAVIPPAVSVAELLTLPSEYRRFCEL